MGNSPETIDRARNIRKKNAFQASESVVVSTRGLTENGARKLLTDEVANIVVYKETDTTPEQSKHVSNAQIQFITKGLLFGDSLQDILNTAYTSFQLSAGQIANAAEIPNLTVGNWVRKAGMVRTIQEAGLLRRKPEDEKKTRKKLTPEEQSKRMQGMWKDPEFRKRNLEAQQKHWSDPIKKADRIRAIHNPKSDALRSASLKKYYEEHPEQRGFPDSAYEKYVRTSYFLRDNKIGSDQATVLRDMHYGMKLSPHQIAKELGFSAVTVVKMFKDARIPIDPNLRNPDDRYADLKSDTPKLFDDPDAFEKLKTLPERLQNIIRGRLAGKTLDEVNEELGLTRERVRQLEAKALALLSSAQTKEPNTRGGSLTKQHINYFLDHNLFGGDPAVVLQDMVHAMDKTDKQIGEDIGVSTAGANKLRRKYHIPSRSRGRQKKDTAYAPTPRIGKQVKDVSVRDEKYLSLQSVLGGEPEEVIYAMKERMGYRLSEIADMGKTTLGYTTSLYHKAMSNKEWTSTLFQKRMRREYQKYLLAAEQR